MEAIQLSPDYYLEEKQSHIDHHTIPHPKFTVKINCLKFYANPFVNHIIELHRLSNEDTSFTVRSSRRSLFNCYIVCDINMLSQKVTVVQFPGECVFYFYNGKRYRNFFFLKKVLLNNFISVIN